MPAFPLSPKELQRYARFATKGGIGSGIAIVDREADEEGSIMFFKGETVIFLTALSDFGVYLGYCEGVIGKFKRVDVNLTTQLKRSVLSPRNSFVPAPPYEPMSRPTTAESDYSPVIPDYRGSVNGGERSSQQVYYDAVDFNSPVPNSDTIVQCSGRFPDNDIALIHREYEETNYDSDCMPSLLASPSSALDSELPVTPPSAWNHSELPQLPPKCYESEMDRSFASSLSLYNSITPEPYHQNNRKSEILSPLRSTSSYSQTSTIAPFHSRFSDGSSPAKSFTPTHFDESISRSTFSSPSTTSPANSRKSRKFSGETSWSKFAGEEEGGLETNDSTEELILDFYSSSRDSRTTEASSSSSKTSAVEREVDTIRFSDEVEELSLPPSPMSSNSRSVEEQILDRLRRGSMPTSPSLDSMVGISQSESSGSLFSSESSNSSNWHLHDMDDSIISSATLFHQPYFSPILLGKETPLTTYTSSIPDSSPLQQARLTRSNALIVPLRLTSSGRSNSTLPKLSVRTSNFTIPLPPTSSADQYRTYPFRSSLTSPPTSPPFSNFSHPSPSSSAWSSIPSSTSSYSISSSVSTSNKTGLRLKSFRNGILGPPRSFSSSTINESGWTTPILSSPRSKDFGAPLVSILSARDDSSSISTRFNGTGNKKLISVHRSRVDYGLPLGSRDFEEETIDVGNTSFEMVKPLAKAFDIQERPSPRPYSHSTRSSIGRSSISTAEQGSPTVLRRSISSHRYRSMDESSSSTSIQNYRARESKWIEIIGSSDSLTSIKGSKKIQTLVQQGIPSSVRARAYSFLSGADELPDEGLYDMLCNISPPRGFERYKQDLADTYSDRPKDMASVLQAFCTWDTGISYHPGLCSLIAYFLSLTPAEETFNLLISLVKNGTLSSTGRVRTSVECLAFNYVLAKIDPVLSKRLSHLSIDPSLYLPSWTSDLFISTLPLSVMVPILDLILFDSTYITKIAIGILEINRARLLDPILSPDRRTILNYLNHLPEIALKGSVLLPTTFSLKIDGRIKKAVKKAESQVPGGTTRQRY